jgi:hypothetical protein
LKTTEATDARYPGDIVAILSIDMFAVTKSNTVRLLETMSLNELLESERIATQVQHVLGERFHKEALQMPKKRIRLSCPFFQGHQPEDGFDSGMRLLEEGEPLLSSGRTGVSIILSIVLLLSIISYHDDTTHRKRSIPLSHTRTVIPLILPHQYPPLIAP